MHVRQNKPFMKKPLLLNFKPYADTKLELLASRIVSQMTGNEYFSDGQDLVHELQVITDQFFKATAGQDIIGRWGWQFLV